VTTGRWRMVNWVTPRDAAKAICGAPNRRPASMATPSRRAAWPLRPMP
jgi:hypothetical protein